MDKKELVALNGVIAGKLKTLLDMCKKEFNQIVENELNIEKPNIFELNTKDFFASDFVGGTKNGIYRLTHNDKEIGLYISKDGVFSPIGRKRNETPKDKEQYDREKKEFLKENADTFKFSATSIKSLRKDIDGSPEGKVLTNILNAVESEDAFVKVDSSFRLNSKKANELSEKSSIASIIENIASKPIKRPGTGLLKMFGYQSETEAKTKIEQSQKDKILHLLLDNATNTFCDKDTMEERVAKLSPKEKSLLIPAISAIHIDAENYTKLNDCDKQGSDYYSVSKSYSVTLKDIENHLKIKENTARAILKKFDVNSDSDKNFEYSGSKEISTTYYIENKSFSDLKSTDFNDYVVQKQELKDLQINLMRPKDTLEERNRLMKIIKNKIK